VLLVQWTVDDRLGAVVTTIDEGSVGHQTVLVDVDSLSRSLLAAPEVVDRYVRLADSFVAAWSSGEPDGAGLYTDDAEVQDSITGRHAVGTEQIEEWMEDAADPSLQMAALGELADADRAPVTDLALYLDPMSFGNDPGRAVGIVRADRSGCVEQTAVVWVLEGDRIATETRYAEVPSHRDCAQRRLPGGWWTGVELPGPRDALVTGVVITSEGRRIAVHNGTDRLEDLILWGLSRYVDAGLAEPQVDSVTFEPSRRCQGVGGRLVVDGAGHDLVLCVDEPDLCGQAPDCARPLLAIRSALLHEMGHAWLRDHADESVRERLLEAAGLRVWSGADVPWAQRGVEYAAEVMAWGLLDETTELQKLGSPPCGELATAFAILTGVESARCDRTAGP
jgi:hypothetical protein